VTLPAEKGSADIVSPSFSRLGGRAEDAKRPHAPPAAGEAFPSGGYVTPPDLSHIETPAPQRFLFPRDFDPPVTGRGDFLVDRITVIFPCFVPVGLKPRVGQCWFLAPGGELESFKHRMLLSEGSWTSKLCIQLHDPVVSDPAHGRSMMAREAHDQGLDVYWFRVDGSPAKFLQGWNVFGSDDLLGLTDELVRVGMEAVGFGADTGARPLVRRGYFTRIDATWNFDLGSAKDAASFVNQVARYSSIVHRRVSSYAGTVLFPARAVSLSVYHKGPEMRAHPGRSIPGLLECADRIVRFEVVSRSERLEAQGLRFVANWSSNKQADGLFKLWWSFVSKLELPQVVDVDLSLLSKSAAKTFFAWKAGGSVLSVCSRATAFRHRREILMANGPDVLKPRPSGDVVEFRRVLRPVPVAVPAEFERYMYRPRAA
jgi:II/X family phage/plasmid replication protein